MTGESVDLCYLAVLIADKLSDTRTYHRRSDKGADTADHMNTV